MMLDFFPQFDGEATYSRSSFVPNAPYQGRPLSMIPSETESSQDDLQTLSSGSFIASSQDDIISDGGRRRSHYHSRRRRDESSMPQDRMEALLTMHHTFENEPSAMPNHSSQVYPVSEEQPPTSFSNYGEINYFDDYDRNPRRRMEKQKDEARKNFSGDSNYQLSRDGSGYYKIQVNS